MKTLRVTLTFRAAPVNGPEPINGPLNRGHHPLIEGCVNIEWLGVGQAWVDLCSLT
jgi:hypothetical protein